MYKRQVETLLAANPISNQFEIAAMNIEYDFGLKAEDVAAYKGVKSNDNGDAGLVLVVEAASGKAQDVVTALESYKDVYKRQLRVSSRRTPPAARSAVWQSVLTRTLDRAV